jgi:hypothetical protein
VPTCCRPLSQYARAAGAEGTYTRAHTHNVCLGGGGSQRGKQRGGAEAQQLQAATHAVCARGGRCGGARCGCVRQLPGACVWHGEGAHTRRVARAQAAARRARCTRVHLQLPARTTQPTRVVSCALRRTPPCKPTSRRPAWDWARTNTAVRRLVAGAVTRTLRHAGRQARTGGGVRSRCERGSSEARQRQLALLPRTCAAQGASGRLVTRQRACVRPHRPPIYLCTPQLTSALPASWCVVLLPREGAGVGRSK